MGILNSWAILVGVLAVGAPIAIHLLTRPKPVAHSLSTIKLVREIIHQRRARNRLRDWLILVLRTAGIALLACAVARPLIKSDDAVRETVDSSAARVILLDVSQSMNAGSGGARQFVQGQAAALEFLDAMPGGQANVIFVGAKARPVFDTISPNLPSLRRAVREVQVRPERANVSSAMRAAGSMLQETKSDQRELVVISDFQRTNWGSMLLDEIPEKTKIQFYAVTTPVLGNLAIADVRFATQPVVGQPASIEIEVANNSDRDANVHCQLAIGDFQRDLTGAIPPHSSRTLSETVTLENTGWFSGHASLMGNLDVLAEDDQRPFVVEVRETPRVLLLSRQSPSTAPSSSWYLEQAFEAILAGPDSGDAVTRLDPSRTNPTDWPDADLFVVDHPGVLPDATLVRIATRVRRGRSLMYVASELADAMNLQKLTDLLGSGFQPPVRLVPTESGAIRKELFVSRIAARRDPFRVLGNSAESALRPVRFGGGLPTEAIDEGLSDQVLAELSDSSALLYLTSVDSGRVSVLNADLGHSNWPVQSTFVPILGELADELLRGGSSSGAAACGEPLVRLLPPDLSAEEDWSIQATDSATPEASDYGSWERSDAESHRSLVWTWADPTGPGIYEMRSDSGVAMAVATAAPSEESDLQSLDESLLTDRIGQGREVGYSDTSQAEQDDDRLWNWLIVACAIGLAGEIAMLRWFRV